MRDIPGFPNYQITKGGRVWSKFSRWGRGKWLKQYSNGGVCYVRLKPSLYNPIHLLVLETYIGPCPNGMRAEHINGNKHDNRLKNLKWGGEQFIGKKFGNWVVLAKDKTKKYKSWVCRCACGTIKTHREYRLKQMTDQSCRKCSAKKRILPEGKAGFNAIYRSYQYAAKGKNLPFSLSKETFNKLICSDCHYCGVEPKQQFRTGRKGHVKSFVYNGIDRINPTRGYIKTNCVPCCKVCNYAKHTMPYKDFLAWLNRIVQFRGKK